jgi:hypothetical protein
MISKKAYKIKDLFEKNGCKGMKMFKFTPISANEWEVESESNKTYTITKISKRTHCSCPQHMFRHGGCKHVDMFGHYLESKEK